MEVRTMTTLVRWDPAREVAAMHTELSRLMNGLFDGAASGAGRPTQSWVPTMDVWETGDSVYYAFDLPGLSEDQISIEVEDGALTVSATRERSAEATSEGFQRFERRYGTFSRTVGLPQGVSDDAIQASYAHGSLEIRVPKPEQTKPKRISIGVNGSAAPTIDAAES
jgi:HSP20 family protein